MKQRDYSSRYYFSYQPLQKEATETLEDNPFNGDLCETDQDKYYYYFDTYPLEYAEFLLDSALARGVYYHTMAANDAFYERESTFFNIKPLNS
jgi:hypothetical protein